MQVVFVRSRWSDSRLWSTTLFPVLISALSLTFLKTAGFGRGGPKGGTSSLAVTDTCWHKTNNSHVIRAYFRRAHVSSWEDETKSEGNLRTRCHQEWWAIHHGLCCAHAVIYASTIWFLPSAQLTRTTSCLKHSPQLVCFSNSQLLQSTVEWKWCHFTRQGCSVPCMLCALYRGSQPAPARKNAGNWRQSCLEQTAWALPGRLRPRCHFLCAFSSGAKEAEGETFISRSTDFVLCLCSSEDTFKTRAQFMSLLWHINQWMYKGQTFNLTFSHSITHRQ